MTTKELFGKVIQERGWYVEAGIRKQNAQTYKKLFEADKLGETSMSNILERLGYDKTVTWKKKKIPK